MKLSDKIRASKEEIKHSQKMNVTYLLYEIFQELEVKNDVSFLHTIPVSIVSANESFFKETFANIIDFDEKYLIKIKSVLNKNNQKIEIEDILNVSKSNFTLGDLIAYSLRYSSIENILKTITSLTEIDFFKNSKELEKALIENYDLEIEFAKKISIDKERILKNLIEIYKIRNVICHDILSAKFKLDITQEKMKEYLIDSIIFQHIIEVKLQSIWKTKELYSTENIEQYYIKEIELRKSKLNELYEIIKKDLVSEEQKLNLEKSKLDFENFIIIDSLNMGNSFHSDKKEEIIFPELVLEYELRLINQRIKNIETDINLSS